MRKGMTKTRRVNALLIVIMTILSILWVMPVVVVVMNSFKASGTISLTPFLPPDKESFMGFANYITGMTFGNYPFWKSVAFSLIITISSVFLILLGTSMTAWYVSRVDSIICKIVYYFCIFSMVVPFQMVMFTLSNVADKLKLNNPFTICIVYLGFGAGLAIFMFTGFVKSIPLELEEAALMDGCNPVQTFFKIIVPIMKPTFISVGILEVMWIWNDYLLPYLVLDLTEYRTIPIHIQYLQGSYGRRDMGAMMALIILCLIPIVIFYALCQKYIIKGVVAGAVKG